MHGILIFRVKEQYFSSIPCVHGKISLIVKFMEPAAVIWCLISQRFIVAFLLIWSIISKISTPTEMITLCVPLNVRDFVSMRIIQELWGKIAGERTKPSSPLSSWYYTNRFNIINTVQSIKQMLYNSTDGNYITIFCFCLTGQRPKQKQENVFALWIQRHFLWMDHCIALGLSPFHFRHSPL